MRKAFGDRFEGFYQLEYRTDDKPILYLFERLSERIVNASIFMLTESGLRVHILIMHQLQMRDIILNSVQSIRELDRQMDSSRQEVNRSKSTDTWECEICSFKNIALLPNCEMCDSNRPGSFKREEPAIQSGFQCHTCKYINAKLTEECTNCGEILIPEEEEDDDPPSYATKSKLSEKKKLISCVNCGFENDPDNQECVSCQNSISSPALSLIPTSKRRSYRAPKPRKLRPIKTIPGRQTCPYCGMMTGPRMVVYGGMSPYHDVCPKMPTEELDIRFKSLERLYCSFCYEKFDKTEKSEEHEKECKGRKDFFSLESETFERTTKLQKDTMIYMHKKCEKFHWMAESSLIKRIEKLGFNTQDLQNLHHYIVNYAPIIIHMHANNHMQFFVKDTHYRNQFQTKKSSGSLSSSSRISWEDRMFDGLHHTASPFERVKYGTINFTNDPKGVRACSGYGQSYFLLKPHVRNRCTVTDMDSSSPSATIGTFQFCYHVLSRLPDAELQAAFSGSKANEVASTMIGTYKQIQIHGPVQFKKDIERVYINKVELADPTILEMVKKFCKDNELEYEVFEYEAVAPIGLLPVASVPDSSFLSPMMTSSASLFAPPIVRPATTHLFGGSRFYVPPAPKKEQKQGVDYI